MRIEDKKIFFILPIIWLIGFVSMIITLSLSVVITSIFNWPNVLYKYFKFFSSVESEVEANVYIVYILITFPIAYAIYWIFLKLIIRMSTWFRNRFESLDLKRTFAIWSILIAYLGFLPLFFTFLLLEQSIINSMTNFFLLIFVGLILPYTNFILKDSQSSNIKNKEKGEEEKFVMNEDRYKLMSLKLHFLYTLIFLIAIACIVGGLALYRQDLAIKGLSNAALLLSIVLAVLAILITLWDVSGQKQNVYDMKKEIEKLSKIVNKTSSFSEKLEGGLIKIEGRYQENTKLLTSLYKLVEDSKQDDKPEEFYEKAKKLFTKNMEFSFNDYKNIKSSKEFERAKQNILSYVYDNPGIKENEVYEHFSKSIPEKYMFFYREALNYLVFNEEIKPDNNGGLISELPF